MDEKQLKELSKDIVLHCFRNTHLENIHAGKKNGGVGEGFSDTEMKKLMIEAVNNTYTFLLWMTDKIEIKDSIKQWIKMSHPYDWDEPVEVKDWI